MNLDLEGRRAVVTGASRGIGRACVVRLVAEGAAVCAVGRDRDLLAELETEIRNTGGSVVCVQADLETGDGCREVVATCERLLGPADILVNVAGAAGTGNVLTLDPTAIDDALRLKLHGYLRLSQLVAPAMMAQGWGRIVNVAGGAGSSPTADNLPTSFANVTVLNLTRGLSDELAPYGVLVNAVCPGFTATDRARTLLRTMDALAGMEEQEAFAEIGRRLPARRIALPSEIAQVVAFLCSAACSYVHGNAIYMDGGARRSTP